MNLNTDAGRYGLPENPALITTSRLRKWWLHSIWGYRVVKTHHQPHNGIFGVTMEDVYLLIPRSVKTH